MMRTHVNTSQAGKAMRNAVTGGVDSPGGARFGG